MNDIIHEIQDLRYLKWTKTRNSSGTAGSFLKSYDETGGRKIYYKLSDYDAKRGIVGHECVNEIVAQRLLDLLGIDHLAYTLVHALVRIDDKDTITYLCMSYDFKSPGESKIPIEDYYEMERRPGESPLDFCKRMHWEEYIFGMTVIDFLISNRDRHGANIEVLFDRKRKKVRPAPLFDHGLSFACRCHDAGELAGFDVMKDMKIQSFVGSNSAFDNLGIVSKDYLKTLPSITQKDIDVVTAGLEDALSPEYIDTIKEMITRRWDCIDDLRNP